MPELPADSAARLAAQLAELGEEFQRSLPERVRQIEAAVRVLREGWDEAALRELSAAAHRLAGAAGTFGHPVLGATALQVEELARRLESDPAARVDSAREAFARLLATLRAAVDAGSALVGTVVGGESVPGLPSAPAQRQVFLVVDDHRVGEEVAAKLSPYGYQAGVFTTAAEMTAAWPRMRPDAIVFDRPGSDGMLDNALLAEARTLAPVPLLIVSARTDIEARLHAFRGGCDAYLSKPVDISVLVDRLDDLLDKHDHRPARVLVVEDDEMTASALVAMLHSAGLLAEAIGHPEELLGRLQEMLPDLIVMDMYLPGCRGDELAGVIRQMDACQGVPIVFLSIEADRGRQLQALEQGGDDFLEKPIPPEHLLRAVVARVERARRMRSLMTRDSLTGLLNHARFIEQLDIEVTRARRTGKPLSAAMIDIDHFKGVNDRYGHAAGDVVIKSIARLLQQRLRQVDLIGRYGGEEFAVAFPETTSAAARVVLEEMGHLFVSQRFRRPDGDFTVSFSAGVASLDEQGEARRLIEAADGALYEAKRLGRNRVEVAAGATLSGEMT